MMATDLPLSEFASILPATDLTDLAGLCTSAIRERTLAKAEEYRRFALALLSATLSALGLIDAARAQAPSPCLVGCLQSASACAPYVSSLFTSSHSPHILVNTSDGAGQVRRCVPVHERRVPGGDDGVSRGEVYPGGYGGRVEVGGGALSELLYVCFSLSSELTLAWGEDADGSRLV